MARSLAGKSKADALHLLDTTLGVTPGSEVLDNLQGDTLPNNPDDITIIIVRPQDTSPVIRAP